MSTENFTQEDIQKLLSEKKDALRRHELICQLERIQEARTYLQRQIDQANTDNNTIYSTDTKNCALIIGHNKLGSRQVFLSPKTALDILNAAEQETANILNQPLISIK